MLPLTLLAWFTSVVDRREVNAEFVDVAGIGLAGRGESGLALSPRVARGTVTAVGVDLCVCLCVCVCVCVCASVNNVYKNIVNLFNGSMSH